MLSCSPWSYRWILEADAKHWHRGGGGSLSASLHVIDGWSSQSAWRGIVWVKMSQMKDTSDHQLLCVTHTRCTQSLAHECVLVTKTGRVVQGLPWAADLHTGSFYSNPICGGTYRDRICTKILLNYLFEIVRYVFFLFQVMGNNDDIPGSKTWNLTFGL